jgi:hypothetical protein
MERFVNMLVVSLGMGVGAYLPTVFGADAFGLWGIFGTAVGGFAAVYWIYRNNFA